MTNPTPLHRYPESYAPLGQQSNTLVAVGRTTNELITRYQNARRTKESTWLECWQAYLGSPEAVTDFIGAGVLRGTTSDAAQYWRHRLHKAKGYSTIETIVAYLTGAFFPNREWVTLVPQTPGLQELEPVLNKYYLHKLDSAGFKGEWSLFLRQLAITGTSCIALPWRREAVPVNRRVKVDVPNVDEAGLVKGKAYRTETVERVVYNAPEFEVVNAFDYWLDPLEANPQRANFVRRVHRTKGQLLAEIQRGLYPHLQPGHVCAAKPCGSGALPTTPLNNGDGRTVQYYQGISWYPDEQVELYEFWGDLETPQAYYEDVHIVTLGAHVAVFEVNPFWGGRPFILGSYTPVVGSPYGLGVLEPALGSLHELDSLTNQRLDNAELVMNAMWTFTPDGVLRVEDVYAEPGRVLQVADHNSVRPLPIGNPNFSVSYSEQQNLEADIDEATGTGSFINVGQGRSGDRVTAQEIQATRDAGGNRLTSVYTWVTETAFTPLLNRVWSSMRQFVTEDEQLHLTVNTPNGPATMWVQVEPTDLGEFFIKPVGAGHIADKEFELNKRLQFLDLVSANPVMSEKLEWVEVMKDLASRFGYDDFDRYMKPEPESDPQQGHTLPVDPTLPPERGALPNTGVGYMDEHYDTLSKLGMAPQQAQTAMTNTGAVTPEQAAQAAEGIASAVQPPPLA